MDNETSPENGPIAWSQDGTAGPSEGQVSAAGSALSPRDEIGLLIAESEGRIGDVYRLDREGLSAEQIAERLNVATQGFVYSYRYMIEAALDGKGTTGDARRRQAISALNGLAK